ncbi:hypothetical protein PAXRUDRAFT_10717 [Paxillus rubicundulus Ve08.2h10]|uniref:HAT C-terminal dimerisation domain-containing protein n=1 Tax=Paxillus rubicundulus Ve08.2h10 TaxID=930991 RepID=A0A0D0E5F8_9AGAM|nr:hypothetical protein PAXRUDRAFT_10717 [Paxillus rubicundulus Ve08.2h10]
MSSHAASGNGSMLHLCTHAASDNDSMLHLHSHEGPDNGSVSHPQAHAGSVLDPLRRTCISRNIGAKSYMLKFSKMQKNWLFKEEFTQMYGNGRPSLPENQKGKLPQLLCELFSDEDEVAKEGEHDVDPQSPWLTEFNLYLHSATSIADGLSIVQWWGLNAQQYPMWASLAQNYLHHGLLCLNLMFHEPAPSSALELAFEEEKEGIAAESTEAEELGWMLELSDDSDVDA